MTLLYVVVCVWLLCVAHTLKITVYIYIQMYMSASFFLIIFSRKTQSRTLIFHHVRFSTPLTFHDGFMFFASRSCFKHYMKPSWKVKGLEKQTSWNLSVLDSFM